MSHPPRFVRSFAACCLVASGLASATPAPIRLATLTPTKLPPPARHAMSISERTDETVINYPTARSKSGVTLAVDRCLAWATQCDQPAADALCRTHAPGRPIAARFTFLKNPGATVIQSSGDHCWDTFCTAFEQVRCVAAPSRVNVVTRPVDVAVATQVPTTAGTRTRPVDGAVATATVDPNTCKSGFVWREARPADLVCVTPEARRRTAEENAAGPGRVDPNGAYGPATCVSGFVWREAFDGDTVCVTPETRDLVRAENQAAATRRVGP